MHVFVGADAEINASTSKGLVRKRGSSGHYALLAVHSIHAIGGVEATKQHIILGLVETVHGLLKEVFQPLAASMDNVKLQAGNNTTDHVAVEDDHYSTHECRYHDTNETPTAATRDAGDATDWATFNSTNRTGGVTVVLDSSIPGGAMTELILLRCSMEPLRALRAGTLHLGGAKWEQLQRVREARAVAGGNDNICEQQYRMVTAAQRVAEEKALIHIRRLLHTTHLWDIMPVASSVEHANANTLSLVSSVGALMHYILLAVHQRHPSRKFLGIPQPDIIPAMAGEPSCLRDSWSNNLLSKNGMTTTENRLRACLLASMQTLDIATLEAKWATRRRLLMSLCTNIQRPYLRTLSS